MNHVVTSNIHRDIDILDWMTKNAVKINNLQWDDDNSCCRRRIFAPIARLEAAGQ